eukprot:UN25639
MADSEQKNVMPSSCTVRESCVIEAPIGEVWNVIGKVDFSWREDVTSCEVKGEPDQLCNRVCTYKDGMTQTKSLRGLNSYDYTATWEMVASEPAVSYSSARYGVSLEEITMTDQTLVIFTTTYSNDATIEVTEDQKWKLRKG